MEIKQRIVLLGEMLDLVLFDQDGFEVARCGFTVQVPPEPKQFSFEMPTTVTSFKMLDLDGVEMASENFAATCTVLPGDVLNVTPNIILS